MSSASTFFHQLNQNYLQVHRTKEALFWDTYMAISDDHAGFAHAEQAFKAFISDPARLDQVPVRLAELDQVPDTRNKPGSAAWRAGWLYSNATSSTTTRPADKCLP